MKKPKIYFFKDMSQKRLWRMVEALQMYNHLTEKQANYYFNHIKEECSTVYWEIETMMDAYIEASDEKIEELKNQLEICQKKQHRLGGDINISQEPTKLSDSLKL